MATRSTNDPLSDPPHGSSAPPTPPAPRAPAQITIRNLRAQPVEVAVLDEGGQVASIRLAPNASSTPVPTDRIAPFTHQLVALGHVRLVPVPR